MFLACGFQADRRNYRHRTRNTICVRVLPHRRRVLRFNTYKGGASLQVLMIFSGAMYQAICNSNVIPVTRQDHNVGLFGTVVPIGPRPIRRLRSLFHLFFFRLTMYLTAIFKDHVHPFTSLVRVRKNRCKGRLYRFTITTKCLRKSRTAKNVPFIRLFIVPCVLVTIRMCVVILVKTAIFFRRRVRHRCPMAIFR